MASMVDFSELPRTTPALTRAREEVEIEGVVYVKLTARFGPGDTVEIFERADKPAGTGVSARDVAIAFGHVPSVLRRRVGSIVLARDDERESAAEVRPREPKRIWLFPDADGVVDGHLATILCHEAGHCFSNQLWPKMELPSLPATRDWVPWAEAMKSDKKDATYYAQVDRFEDFAESTVAYFWMKHAGRLDELAAAMPARTAILDFLYGNES